MSRSNNNNHSNRNNNYNNQNNNNYSDMKQHPYQSQRERSGQRNQSGGQYHDSSMTRDNNNTIIHGNQSNSGSIRFVPGASTTQLPPIETKPDGTKKFAGRCRLFIGNLPHNTSEDKLRGLFEKFGEIGECFLGPKSAFAFIKMDTRQSAEAARDALDCSIYEGRTLRVRLAAHAAAIRIKHLSPLVTNELLVYAFRYFGEIERAVVVVDDKGRSTGEGVVEFHKKQSAIYAIKRCQQECFMLTASPKPVLVEPFDQQDEDEGLPEKSINRNSIEFKEQREVGPRFAEQGSFEHTFGLKWKELYEVEKGKREHLEHEIQEARKNLQDQMEYSRLEHDTMQLRSRLQQLEDNRMKLQQMKEQTVTGNVVSILQQRDELRRQQDLLIRNREDDLIRRQQRMGDLTDHNQQGSAFNMQVPALQDLQVNNQEHVNDESNELANQPQPIESQQHQQLGSQTGNGDPTDPADPALSINSGHMMAPQMQVQPLAPRTFADAAMMGMNQPQFIPAPQMAMPINTQMNPPNMYAFMQPPPQHPMQMQLDGQGNPNFADPPMGPPGFAMYAPQQPYQQQQHQQQQPPRSGGSGRQQKFNRQYNNNNNNNNQANNNASQSGGNNSGGRQRKRGRF